MGKGQGPALVAQILLILCVVSDGSLLANGQETRTLQKVTTHNLLLLIKGGIQLTFALLGGPWETTFG